jgi:hypothetical protein
VEEQLADRYGEVVHLVQFGSEVKDPRKLN